MKINFIDHIVLMIKDVKRTEEFYSKLLGPAIHKDQDSVCFKIGDTKIFFGLPYSEIKDNAFDADRIGLNHLAFGVRTEEELKEMEKTLNKHNIKNSGIKIDKYGKKPFIWFDDSDNIRLEFYLREE